MAGLQFDRLRTRRGLRKPLPKWHRRVASFTDGRYLPKLAGDSKEIYFIGLDGALHAAGVNTKSNEFELEGVARSWC